ncbi:cell cycle checkpoint protein RAD17-like isoform X2 [Ornithodoros turicata]|uniref:cell cycle checkpoint protein RAD17-like isoform X2 n=1 Tax=Ornithodoros turicata TaxID=34597 RepID=UPI003138E242
MRIQSSFQSNPFGLFSILAVTDADDSLCSCFLSCFALVFKLEVVLPLLTRMKSSWVTPEGGMLNVFSRTSAAKTAKRPYKGASTSKQTACNWAQNFTPKKKVQLAVNKKKVEEVEQRLQESLDCRQNGVPILLLCGPSGSGKTATVQCLASDMGLGIQEWTNPVSLTTFRNPELELEGYWRRPEFFEDNQMDRFENFLFRADRYKSLLLPSAKQIILVEEFPNIYLRDLAAFHRLLRSYSSNGHTTLIFIISESSANIEQKLFPRDLVAELGIKKIVFNAVAPTLLTKGLKRVAEEAQTTLRVAAPSPGDVEQIVASCRGDIRSAVNALEFLCAKPAAKGFTQMKPPQKRTRKGTSKVAKQAKAESLALNRTADFGGRDTALQLFHSLGKVLYCKREPAENMAQHDTLPDHLKHMERPPPLEVPEEVFERTAVSEDLFLQFLHHNAAHFYADIDTASDCSDWFSESDYLQSEWSSENQMASFALSVATRGLMFDLRRPEASRGWRPLEKPQWNLTSRNVKQKIHDLKNTFMGWCSTGIDLQLDFVPYLSLLQPKGLDLCMQRVASEIGRFRAVFRRPNEVLGERDYVSTLEDENVGDEDCSTNQDTSTRSNLQTVPAPSDDEVEIEDFDD